MTTLLSFFLLMASMVTVSGQYDQHRTFLTSQLERTWNNIFDDDRFGTRVAASTGNLVAVSSKSSLNSFFDTDEYDPSLDLAKLNGRVYIFDTEASSYTPTATIDNPRSSLKTAFGEDAIAITSNRLFVGDSKRNNVGCVYVYGRLDNSWTLIQTISPSSLSPYQFFGKNLDVAKNGSILVVTASGSRSFMGVVFVYKRSQNNTYLLSQELTSEDKINGMYSENDDGYYDYKGDDDVYMEHEVDDDDNDNDDEDDDDDDDMIAADDATFENGAFYEFGRSISLDENQLAVSQVRNENMTASVKIYTLVGSKYFVLKETLSEYSEKFGDLIHIQDNVLLIHASALINGTEPAASVVNLYSRASDETGFSLQHQLVGNDLNHFGASLASYNNLLFVGAPYESSGTGSVYVYRNNGGNWSLISNDHRRKLVAKDGLNYDLFGSSLAISSGDGLIVIGAPNKRKSGFSRAGALYFIYADEINFIDDDETQHKTHHYVKKSLFSLILLGIILPVIFFWVWPKRKSPKQNSTSVLSREAQEEEEVATPLRRGQYFTFDPLSKSIKLIPKEGDYEIVDVEAESSGREGN